MDVEACELLGPETGPDGLPACRWCRGPLPPARRRWCSDVCALAYRIEHHWPLAREAALDRDGHTCTICGAPEPVEVHHDPPALHYRPGCQHHLAKLTTLCRAHHGERRRRPKDGRPVQLTLIAA